MPKINGMKKIDLTLRLDPITKQALRKAALDRGVRTGRLGREIIDDWIRANQKPSTT
jgi:hypothetical protein